MHLMRSRPCTNSRRLHESHAKSCSIGTRPSRKERRGVTAQAMQSLQSTPVSASASTATRVRLNTRSDCELAVSIYPTFAYNAAGGGGWGTVTHMQDGTLFMRFDISSLFIPDLNYKTASIFGIPIPPPLNIAITPLRLENKASCYRLADGNKIQGTLDPTTGVMSLNFDAEFRFTATSLYKPPALIVNTLLSTEAVQGRRLGGSGRRLVNNAGCLAGVSNVVPVNDTFLDTFLLLPNDALAVLSAELEFS